MTADFALTAPASPMRGGARFSDCGRYRIALWRRWGSLDPTVLWIMLNPSRAGSDPTDNDPTIKKCCGFARRWGYGGIYVVNLYQLIETDSRRLIGGPEDPRGPDWWAPIVTAAQKHPRLIVCAWGSQGPEVDGHASWVVSELEHLGHVLHCLGRTKGGAPRHPVRLGYDAALEPYGGSRG